MARITVHHHGGDAFGIDIRGHSLTVDQRAPGYDERGPTPVEQHDPQMAEYLRRRNALLEAPPEVAAYEVHTPRL